MKYDLVLFDLDGTLVDTSRAIAKVLKCSLEELGLKTYTLAESTTLIGGGVSGLVEKILKKEKYPETVVKREDLLETIRKYYKLYYNYDVKLYDGIDRLLDFLEENSIKKGIVTNKDHLEALNTVEKNMSKWNFVEIIGANDEKHPKKPDPYGVNKIASETNTPLNKVLYVGDMMVDLNTSKNANVDIVYCNGGFGTVSNETGIPEDIRVSSVDELIEKILGK